MVLYCTPDLRILHLEAYCDQCQGAPRKNPQYPASESSMTQGLRSANELPGEIVANLSLARAQRQGVAQPAA